MSIPTDPYNAPNRRPFDEGDVLEPLSDESALSPTESAISAEQEDNADTPHSAPGNSDIDENPAFGDAVSTEEENIADPLPSAFPDIPSDSSTDSPTFSQDVVTSAPVSPLSETNESTSSLHFTEENGATQSITDPDLFTDIPSSDASVRTALAASVGLGGTIAEPTESHPEDVPTVGFMPQETPEQTEARRERWASNPNIPSEIPDAPKGRGLVHTGVLFASLILVPVAWYLVSDAHTRLSVAQAAHATNFAGAAELLGGVGVLALIWLLARSSSLGVNVSGAIIATFGAVGLAFPSFIRTSVLNPVAASIEDINPFFGNVAHHFRYDTLSGLMFIFGMVLVFTGIVSHSTRRRGEVHGAILAKRELMGS